LSWPIGLAFAFGSAVLTMVGFFMRHRGATAAPDVDVRRPFATVRGLFSQKWWTIGFGVAIVAWLLHVAGLQLSPLSLVQAVLASSFIMLGVVAEKWFGFHLRRREWVGIGLTAGGLILIAATATEAKTGGSHSSYALDAAIAFEAALVAGGVLCMLSRTAGRVNGYDGPLLGAGAGLMFTVSHIGIKAIGKELSVSDPSTLLTPWAAVIVAAFVVAFFASARSLQIGPAVPVIAVTGAVSNATAIAAGIVVFGDPLGSNGFVVAARLAAFALVVFAVALIPAPTRAVGAEEEPAGAEEEASPARARPEPRSRPRRIAAGSPAVPRAGSS
jgi:drug/metabolite transporter (DMT)-like permease